MPPVTRSQSKEHTFLLNMATQYNFQIPLFDGNSETVHPFCTQVQEMAKVNKWDDEVSLLFFKSKLTGAAQKYFFSSPSCKNCATLVDACKTLTDFFSSPVSTSTNMLAFQNIKLMPGETIKNLVNRIEILAHQAYPTISDQPTMDSLKRMQLLNALPNNIRERLWDYEELSFALLTEKAIKLTTADQNRQVNFVANTSEEKDNIHVLTEMVSKLQVTVDKLSSSCPLCNKNHKLESCPSFFQPPRVPEPTLPQMHPPIVTCRYCYKRGHSIQECWHRNNNRQNRTAIYRPSYIQPVVPARVQTPSPSQWPQSYQNARPFQPRNSVPRNRISLPHDARFPYNTSNSNNSLNPNRSF